ncbi:hypothetical protein C8F01DRAFT_955642, partial [Mycena amicta]
ELAETGNAVWYLCDLATLVEAVQPHAAAAGDGDKFKAPAICAAVALLNQCRLGGGPKKYEGTKKKLIECLKIYKAVTYLKSRSGGTFDDILGANVITPDEDLVWRGVVEAYPD